MAMTMEGTAMTDTAIEVQSGILPEKWNGRAVFTPTHLAEIFDRSLSRSMATSPPARSRPCAWVTSCESRVTSSREC